MSERQIGSRNAYRNQPGHFFALVSPIREQGIRVIVPLVDQWRWWGGIEQYAAFRDQPAESFWTDRRLIEDFKATIRHTLTRTNTLTGIRYCDDPTIFGWETGNELNSPEAWTHEIAAYLRALDPHHLIIDGRSMHGIAEYALRDDKIDVVTTHHYPSESSDMVEDVRVAIAAVDGRKPYFVGEFGFVPTTTIDRVFETVVDSSCSGALLWSLRFHSRDGGFYWHTETTARRLFKAYHWPGFESGQEYDESIVLERIKQFAYRIRGEQAPVLTAPAPPHCPASLSS
jgi:endo-1,4-beta-mannosidase